MLNTEGRVTVALFRILCYISMSFCVCVVSARRVREVNAKWGVLAYVCVFSSVLTRRISMIPGIAIRQYVN